MTSQLVQMSVLKSQHDDDSEAGLEHGKHGGMDASVHRMVRRRIFQAACVMSIAVVGYIIRSTALTSIMFLIAHSQATAQTLPLCYPLPEITNSVTVCDGQSSLMALDSCDVRHAG